MNLGELDLPAMKRIAGGTLVVLVGIYLLTFVHPDPGWGVILLRAAAGAGIVGALADWFAVVALFRHPLGLPIPHTALLPRNQRRVAVNVGRFIEDNFLRPDLIQAKMRETGVSRHVAQWVLQEGRSGPVVHRTLATVAKLLRAETPPGLVDALTGFVREHAEKTSHSRDFARKISHLLQNGARGEALTDILVYLHETVDTNRPAVERLVRNNSRWWLSSRIDKGAATMITNGVLSVLDDLSQGNSPLRAEFEDAALRALTDFVETDRLQHLIEASLAAYLGTQSFDEDVHDFMEHLKQQLAEFLETPEVAQAVQDALRSAAQRLVQDPALQTQLDQTVADVIAEIIPDLRPHVGAFVAQTIADWDPDLLVERFETEAGRDLQFIRINGAVLGFAMGGVLFAIEHTIG